MSALDDLCRRAGINRRERQAIFMRGPEHRVGDLIAHRLRYVLQVWACVSDPQRSVEIRSDALLALGDQIELLRKALHATVPDLAIGHADDAGCQHLNEMLNSPAVRSADVALVLR